MLAIVLLRICKTLRMATGKDMKLMYKYSKEIALFCVNEYP